MVNPGLDYRLDERTLATFGRMVVTYAHIDEFLNMLISNLQQYPQPNNSKSPWDINNIAPKIAALRTIAEKADPNFQKLVEEFRLAMVRVTPARNFLAHGVILFGEEGKQSFWSRRRLKEMDISDVLQTEPWFNYAHRLLIWMNWHPEGVKGWTLPERPS